MKVIAVINQKGGVGKTTTAYTVATGLHLRGYKTLSIDLDQQENFTFTINVNADKSIYDVLTGNVSIEAAVNKTDIGDVIIADKALAAIDTVLNTVGKEYKLKEALDTIKDNYDYVIIDTPPALGILTVNALAACDSVIIPAQADIYSLQGIKQLEENINVIRKYCNPSLKIEGILLTRYSARSILSREVTEMAQQLAEGMNTKVFESKIREAVCIKESQISQQSLFTYAPKAKVTEDYSRLIDELLKEEK